MRTLALSLTTLCVSISAWPGDVLVIDAPTPEANANLGFRATSGIGDIDGDGLGDFLLGAYRADVPGTGDAGAVYVYAGSDGSLIDSLASPNPEFGGWFGHSALGIDDVNRNGTPDIAVGASAETPGVRGAGRVYVFDGATRSLLYTLVSPNPSNFGQFGVTLGRVPDTNADGVDEVAVGAFREALPGVGEAGRAYLFDGATGTLLHTFEHPQGQGGAVFGISVDGLDDVNGDGAGDVVVGASGSDVGDVVDAGAAFVFDGATGALLHTLTSNMPAPGGIVGFEVAGVPDLTGDGIMDIVLGGQADPVDGIATGRVHVFNGATGAWRYAANPDPREGAAFGIWVDGIADVNGDGSGDIIVGAQSVGNGCVTDAGRGYLLNGDDGALLRTFNATEPQAGAFFGFALAATEDANADGRGEVIIAAWGETVDGLTGAGRAYVFYSPLLNATDGGATLSACREACGGAPDTDEDGDGLTACVEECLGTQDNLVDSDFDGMPDNFEAQFGLDPLRDDSGEDPDGDGLANIDEYLRNASPADARDPGLVVFVRPDGRDAAGNGSLDMPYQTIGFALSQVSGSASAPARIVVLCGEYQEDLTLKPFVAVEGVPGADVAIRGAVQGAEGAGVADLRLQNPNAGELLNIFDTGMTVRNVFFAGTAGLRASGILAEGDGVAGTVIEGCTFSDLAVGLEITGTLPTVRRCIFERCSEAGVLVHGEPEKALAKTLGDQTDPRTGWNTFRNNGNFNIVNERTAPLSVEFNDWSINDPAAIAATLSGPVDFEPFLEAGKGILAASLACTVWDAATQARIETASVALAPGGYTPVTENIDGVYAYPALPGGNYTLTVSAPDYPDATLTVTIADSEMVSVTVPLGAAALPPGGCGCAQDTKSTPTRGDALPIAAVVLLLTLEPARRRMVRKRPDASRPS